MAEQHVEKAQKPADVPAKHRDGVITVVLTADNHLGTPGQHPRKREERQQNLRRAFQQATDFAVVQGVDLFIQAGDLFDSSTPDERDRSFVAARLAQLKQAGVRTFALGGVHDTPQRQSGARTHAPQMSYASLGALHYFPPLQPEEKRELEPVVLDIEGIRVGLCGLGVLAGQEGDPLAQLQVASEIERAVISILLLHAPIEGFSIGSSLLDTRAQVSRASIARQTTFRHILAGYHHGHSRSRIGQTDLIIAGATQHIDFTTDHAPGFVFLGIAADGLRWCNHISVDTQRLERLSINTGELWPQGATVPDPTEAILEQLRPLCAPESMVQVCLNGELTRRQYHQLDLNRIRHYGEEHCFALAIDDSALLLLPEQESSSAENMERFSPREEIIALTREWVAASADEQEKKALQIARDELLLALEGAN
jgi:DNA repair exonuclease SbcCD nuclease subunit